MDIMFTTYGSEAGVAALKWLPYGGLYIAGGIAPKNIDYITEEGSKFMEAFYDKGRVSKVLRDVPVKVVLAEDIGQRGAQLVAMRMLMDARSSKTKKVKVPRLGSFGRCFTPLRTHVCSRQAIMPGTSVLLSQFTSPGGLSASAPKIGQARGPWTGSSGVLG